MVGDEDADHHVRDDESGDGEDQKRLLSSGHAAKLSRMSSMAAFDVAIVGASIGGCTAARLFGLAGLRVALIERRPDPAAYKVTCTHAILSSAVPTMERVGIAPLLDARGAIRTHPAAWSPYGGWMLLPTDVPHGYGVTRADPRSAPAAARGRDARGRADHRAAPPSGCRRPTGARRCRNRKPRPRADDDPREARRGSRRTRLQRRPPGARARPGAAARPLLLLRVLARASEDDARSPLVRRAERHRVVSQRGRHQRGGRGHAQDGISPSSARTRSGLTGRRSRSVPERRRSTTPSAFRS